MTRSDFLIKWGVYILALLPVWFFEAYVLNRFPFFGVIPMLLPQAAIVVAVLEGATAGAGFGLGVGILCDALYFGSVGGMTLALALLGMATGVAAQYALRQNFVGCLLCSAAVLLLIDGGRIVTHLVRRAAEFPALLRVAGLEILWSLVFLLPVYLLFRWVHQRAPVKTLL